MSRGSVPLAVAACARFAHPDGDVTSAFCVGRASPCTRAAPPPALPRTCPNAPEPSLLPLAKQVAATRCRQPCLPAATVLCRCDAPGGGVASGPRPDEASHKGQSQPSHAPRTAAGGAAPVQRSCRACVAAAARAARGSSRAAAVVRRRLVRAGGGGGPAGRSCRGGPEGRSAVPDG